MSYPGYSSIFRLRTIRAQVKKLNAIFFDDIFVVGSRVFSFLKARLQQMMETTELFDAISLINVGDLF